MEMWLMEKWETAHNYPSRDGGRMVTAGNSSCICSVSVVRRSCCRRRGMTGRWRADVPESTPICLGSSPGWWWCCCAQWWARWGFLGFMGTLQKRARADYWWLGPWFSLHLSAFSVGEWDRGIGAPLCCPTAAQLAGRFQNRMWIWMKCTWRFYRCGKADLLKWGQWIPTPFSISEIEQGLLLSQSVTKCTLSPPRGPRTTSYWEGSAAEVMPHTFAMPTLNAKGQKRPRNHFNGSGIFSISTARLRHPKRKVMRNPTEQASLEVLKREQSMKTRWICKNRS